MKFFIFTFMLLSVVVQLSHVYPTPIGWVEVGQLPVVAFDGYGKHHMCKE